MFNASLIKHPNQNQTKNHQIYFFSIFQIKLNELKLQERHQLSNNKRNTEIDRVQTRNLRQLFRRMRSKANG